jgi:hypothetical protein
MFALLKAVFVLGSIGLVIYLLIRMIRKTDVEIKQAQLEALSKKRDVLAVRGQIAEEVETLQKLEKTVAAKEAKHNV